MRKTIAVILSAAMIICCIPLIATATDFPGMQVEIKAKSAVLMEAQSGRVLMAMNADGKIYPASVTKIMSMLLVTEAIDRGDITLTDVVTASRFAASKGGSQIWLKEGEQMTVDDLLKATAVASANDACTALGEYVAGSDTAFVALMNERAKQLGMNGTNFENCTGLDDTCENHLTTAYDVALMSRELIKHELILNYSTIWTDTLRGGETELVNTNKLIRYYDGAIGLKTGTTSKAGCCVSAVAQRDGMTLIAVVMGSDNSNDRFNGARAMLDWGFANYTCVPLETEKRLITDVTVIDGTQDKISPIIPDSVTAVIQKGRQDDITREIDLAVDVQAPVEQGQILGTVTFVLDSDVLAVYELKAPAAVEKLSTFERFARILMQII